VGSFGPQSCLNQFDGATIPSPLEGERVALRAETLASSGEARAGMNRGRAS